MPWVSSHRRRVPGSWFRSTTVRSHHRRRPGAIPLFGIIGIVVAVLVILALIVAF